MKGMFFIIPAFFQSKAQSTPRITVNMSTHMSGNHYLIVVERFVCPYEPGSCVVWSWLLLVGTPMANWSQARGQTKNGSKDPMEDRGRKKSDPTRRKPGVHFWGQTQKEDPQASAWWPGMPPSPARHSPNKQRGYVATWRSLR